MNHLQRMWVKAYQDYLDAAKDTAKNRNQPLHTSEIFMARKHADATIKSLKELEN